MKEKIEEVLYEVSNNDLRVDEALTKILNIVNPPEDKNSAHA